MSRRTFTSASDLTVAMPAHPGARLDRLESAIASLGAEQRRLERLGLAGALAECRRQLRYWQFVRALFAIDPALGPARKESR
ncbi:MAG: hypothetical protein HYR73_08865 [Candidatus Eisenbacteria bacterium]|nr:hypothetical protein [Candidatus Eisenbacteria bacterium]